MGCRQYFCVAVCGLFIPLVVGSLRLLGPVHRHHVKKNERFAWLRGALGALSHMNVFVSRVPVDLRQCEQEFVHGRGQRRMRM